MNILHVIDMISQTRAGGSAKVPFQLGEAQARLGHNVTIYSSDYNAEKQRSPKGVALIKFKTHFNLLGIKITLGMLRADFSKFDIIHLHNYRTFVNIIAVSKGVPCVLQAHGSAAPMKAGLSMPIHKYLWRERITKRCSAYIADAELEIDQYVAEGADRDKVSLIPVGIDCREFMNLPKRSTDGQRRVLFLGRFHENKGPDLLIKAFPLLKRDDVTLQLAGYDDGYAANLLREIKKLSIFRKSNIEYLIPCYGKDKVNAYTNADVYVMPSRRELFGLTLLEALACGTPVIITDRCGVAPLLPKECGAVVPFNEDSLAGAINTMLDNDAASAYRQYRIAWAKQYDWAKLAPQVMRVYEKVL